MNTIDIINSRISLCLDVRVRSYQIITVFEALNAIRIGRYKTEIDNIRCQYGLGKSAITAYRSKKKKLPAVLFSGIIFDSGFKFDIYGYTSMLVVDIDKLESIDATKESLKNDQHIIATWLSPSGNGLKALFYLEYDKPFSKANTWLYHEYCAFPQIENYLRRTHNISIDNTGADITRLCFVSYDPEIHLKRDFEPFVVSCNLSNTQIHKLKWRYYNSRKGIRNALKEEIKIAKLLKKSRTSDDNILE
ncbi:MAG: hypothetical protein K2M65_03625 [Muribaculaceae bacterium]|nr:hypothetical protein [Muribaculaceae bacterium]